MSDPLDPALWAELYDLILGWVQAEVFTLDSLI